jgi:hypothetical protein
MIIEKVRLHLVSIVILAFASEMMAGLSNHSVDSVSKSSHADFQDTSVFVEVGHGLPAIGNGSLSFGDFDKDGDLDLLVSGFNDTGFVLDVFRNDSGDFSQLPLQMPKIWNQGVVENWNDFDGDNDLDLVISGATVYPWIDPQTVLFQNSGSTFTEIGTTIPPCAGTCLRWGDYDMDGDQDILMTGTRDEANTFFSSVYRNDSPGIFTDINAGLVGAWRGPINWIDLDKDGDLDIFLTGWTGTSVECHMYRNEDGNFVDIPNEITPVVEGRADWGDYDNDGDLDLLLTGSAENWSPFTTIYRNDAGVFVDIHPPFPPLGRSLGAWGDYDNDGDLDVLLSGERPDLSVYATVFRNDPGYFVDINPGLGGGHLSEGGWVDYDNDGDLDIILSGGLTIEPFTSQFTKIYKNKVGRSNTSPSPPSGLTSASLGHELVIHWGQSSDDETAQAALSYNVRMGSSPGGTDIASPLSDSGTGKRFVSRIGNSGLNTSMRLRNLADGRYYWSVQTIDDFRAGSKFAVEQQINVNNSGHIISISDIPNDQGGNVRITWQRAFDDTLGSSQQIFNYGIWRKIPPVGRSVSPTRPSLALLNDTLGLYYDFISTVPAIQSPEYNAVGPTLSDSSGNEHHKYTFLVTAHTNDPNVFFISLADSGYSVDNLSPIPPAGLVATVQAGPQVQLTWNSPSDPDVGRYEVYRSTTSGFTPDSGLKIGEAHTTTFIDGSPIPGVPTYYRLIAIDVHGNMSLPSAEALAEVTTTLGMSVTGKWNMVSVPLTIDNYARTSVFPTSMSNAYRYNYGYFEATTLTNGRGYWLKFAAPQSVTLTGLLITVDTIDVVHGWNMIGSISVPVPISTIETIPPGILDTQVYGYDNGYKVPLEIVPGKGYWVKVSASGKVILRTSE